MTVDRFRTQYFIFSRDIALSANTIVATSTHPAGTFSNCMKIKEGTALDVNESEYKYYAPEIGLIRDEDLLLTKYGFANN